MACTGCVCRAGRKLQRNPDVVCMELQCLPMKAGLKQGTCVQQAGAGGGGGGER